MVLAASQDTVISGIDLEERPAAKSAVVVHCRHPKIARRGRLGDLVGPRFAGDFAR